MSYATSDKRIEALKDERRQLISAKQNLERRIDELCQENERLQSVVSDGADNARELQAENANLLWLVNDMRACFRIGAERDGVSKQWCYELFDSYTSKLRELGIEVTA